MIAGRKNARANASIAHKEIETMIASRNRTAASAPPRRRRALRAALALAVALGTWLALAGPASAAIQHEFRGSFDGSDAPEGPLGLISGAAVDASGGASSGDVYVGYINVETFASAIDKFDTGRAYAGVHLTGSNTPQGSFGLISFETLRLGSIAVDGSLGVNGGDLYVADVANGVVDRFNEDGSFDCQITARPPASRSAAEAAAECNGAAGSEPPQHSIEPTGLAVDKVTGKLYVADAKHMEGEPAHDVIDVFSPSGAYLEQITDSHITDPASITVDSSGNLYVANVNVFAETNGGVAKFHNGAFVSVLDENAPSTVGVDQANDHVYAFDTGEPGRIAEYSSSGNRLTTFGSGQNVYKSLAIAVGPAGDVYLTQLEFGNGKVYVYGPDVVVPDVTTGEPTEVEATTATLTGEAAPDTANGGGNVTSCEFKYGETVAYGKAAPCSPATSYSAPTPVSAELTGLTPNTTYHYRLIAENAEGTGEGEDRTFTTRGPPAVDSESATAGVRRATVRAQINPFGYKTSCVVQYVEDASFQASGYSTATTVPCPESLGSGFGDDAVELDLEGLQVGTIYHYRFLATNQADTTFGVDQTFATFGIESFSFEALDEEGNPYSQAGGHPYEMTTSFALNRTEDRLGRAAPDGNLKDVITELPPGLLGDPTVTPKCTPHKVSTFECSGASQIGTIVVTTQEETLQVAYPSPVFNVEAPPGVAARFGARINNVTNAFIDVRVRSGGDYGVSGDVLNISAAEAVIGASVTLWGVPAAASHDPERSCTELLPSGVHRYHEGCSSGVPVLPFLTNPTSCDGPLNATMRADAWQEPGEFASASDQLPAITGCDRLHFDPTIEVKPVVSMEESPAGLHVDLHVPQNQNYPGLAEANLKDAIVRLPAGLAVNPSAANGLGACSAAQIGYKPGTSEPAEFTSGPAECPDASRIGNVEIETPLLDHRLKGGVYIAKPHDNPFNSLLAIYIAVNDPQTGVVVKLPGHVVADPNTGQLTTTFADNPQLPFKHFELDFFGGPRAALMTPPTCGEYTTTTDMTPWTSPEGEDAHPSSPFQIGSGPGGSACAKSPGELPNSPGFSAGTLTPLAGAYSPFVLHLGREDGSQRLSTIDTVLPPGLVGKLAGIPYCPQAAIDLARSREHEGGGAEEQASPSCPVASRVGAVNVGAGAGPQPFYVQGAAYLAGAYKGAPLSLVIVTPAVAGPYDLGTVVVRAALYVNPETAQITAKSDPIPTILQGIPLDIRSIALRMDRPEFTLNPTSCEAMSVTGTAFSVLGQAAPLSNRFQVGACAALGFKPQLHTRLFGATHRGAHPKLRAVLTMPKADQANIARAVVSLPHSEFLDQGHIRTICTRVQFAEGSTPGERCPPGSVYGHAKAITPLLDQPLEGPVYLRSSSHNLPDLVAALNGQIQIVLDGRIDSIRGGIRTTFEAVPDAPVSKFVLTMQGGRKGLLVNSRNICERTYRAVATFKGQNGRFKDLHPALKNSHCR